MSLGTLLVLTACLLSLFQLRRSFQRAPEDVLDDLDPGEYTRAPEQSDMGRARSSEPSSSRVVKIIQREAQGTRAAIRRDAALCMILSPLLLLLLRAALGALTVKAAMVTGGIGIALGYLAAQARQRRRVERYRRVLEFYLPMVMERLVMAVQSGHDVLAAIRAVLDLNEKGEVKSDPVSRLLELVYSLTESGVGLENSLQDVAAAVECPAVKHAFVHLAQAHREGGELVMPLRELSDSTQLYYQESVEEEIAKLPVRATLPLLFTFAGLMVFFLTAPLMQVLDITTKAMPK